MLFMTSIRRLVFLSIALAAQHFATAPADSAECVVAAVQPLAVDAGLNAFREGGNAVDAAIATALTLGVVDSHNSGLGGGCFILLRLADGTLAAIDGREMAPAAATRDMYLRDGKAVAELSQTGPLAIGVPGALAAYERALEKYGRRSLRELILPAAKIAAEGFPIDRVLAGNLKRTGPLLRRFPASAQAFLKPDGSPPAEGDVLRQPDLANSYRSIARQGTQWFYHGEFAERVAAWMSNNGGILTANDFANYVVREREPVVTEYRDYQIVGFPPPSSGGVHVAQILNIVENFPLGAMHRETPDVARHAIVEAMKLAFADRAYWLGDADFVDVPRGLVDKTYARKLAKRIDLNRTSNVKGHGTPPAAEEDLFGNKHTTHIAAADSEGNWVAITQTVNTSFGSKVVAPGTGIVLNNEMDDFSAQPGVPNAFNLIGAENNAVAPGKRPLSSMSPTIVLRSGKPVMALGAAGGPKIITQVVLALIRVLDFGQELSDAIAGPRFHHQWRPDFVLLEESAPAEVRAAFESAGHELRMATRSGVSQAVGLDANGQLIGVHDPRVPGKAAKAER